MDGFRELDSSPKQSKKILLSVFSIFAIIGIIAAISVLNSSQNTCKSSQYQIEENEFQDYLSKWNKIYSDELEYQSRFKIYKENSVFIRNFNSQGHSWTLKLNEFADMTPSEFKSIYTPTKIPYKTRLNIQNHKIDANIPAQVDWTVGGAVTYVKNQGQCGSCWAFSTTGSVEGAWFIAGHPLTPFSEQELVDCSSSYGNFGCNGGLMDNAFQYIIANGISTENSYPYTARDGICNKDKTKVPDAQIASYADVTQNNINALQAAVSQQPVSVAVEADQAAWQFYSGGVVTDNCGNALDHGVLVVGYNMNNTPPYWKVKNSWGAEWGEAGYIRIAIVDGDGVCGIQMQPSYPIV
ncbi:unnamed protein product [Blepharisma stoltei]|uniref:Papain family cysteine protease n=1 Tax=Blepharisma stoltei TaxID=1481888 RepID=A0AAU9JGE3_9CILI|nr:unnamed protein product [Blepharisma stoltei]